MSISADAVSCTVWKVDWNIQIDFILTEVNTRNFGMFIIYFLRKMIRAKGTYEEAPRIFPKSVIYVGLHMGSSWGTENMWILGPLIAD